MRTLQELLAPEHVIFLSKNWSVIGTNYSLASFIESETSIDADVLTRKKPLESVSIARRMFWASERSATRVEDEAYSLMGLFGVHMPAAGGDFEADVGPDVFAWGNVLPVRTSPLRERLTFSDFHVDSYLFALAAH